MLKTSAMPGAESAVLRLASAFKELGHNVFICKKIQDLDKVGKIDVLLIKRNPSIALDEKCTRAKKIFFYSPDGSHELSFLALRDGKFRKKFLSLIDGVLALSNYQSETFTKDLRIPQEKIIVTRNGADLKMYKSPRKKRKPICIYSSVPDRGLDLFLKIWPEVKKKVPEAILKVFSSMSLYDWKDSFNSKKTINKVKKMDGVVYSKPVLQEELAKELLKAKLLLYPNCYDLEISCISVIEARVAGCVVVTSDLAGLKETAYGNVLISSKPGSSDYINAFTKKTIFLLKNNPYWERISQCNLKTAFIFNWKYIAKELIDIFENY